MKRTIKFRGKNRVGKWLYGDLLHRDNESYILPKDALDSMNNYWTDFDTVSQFTGRLDKNGTEIYEGDIVRNKEVGGYGMVYIGVVRYYEEDCRFGIDLTATNKITKRSLFAVGERSFNDGHCTIKYYNEYEVLGNTHDNPELLKSL